MNRKAKTEKLWMLTEFFENFFGVGLTLDRFLLEMGIAKGKQRESERVL